MNLMRSIGGKAGSLTTVSRIDDFHTRWLQFAIEVTPPPLRPDLPMTGVSPMSSKWSPTAGMLLRNVTPTF